VSLDRAKTRTVAWIAAVAGGWLLAGWFVTDLGFYATDWLSPSQGLVDWGTIASYAAAGVVAFLVFAALRRWAGAPRLVWVSVAVIEGTPVVMFFVALLALALGNLPPVLYPFILSKSDAGALPVAEQLQVFATWWVWSSAFLILGAWAGCRVEPAVQQSRASTPSV